tara:strand:- start:229 stop:438 length:210 start_codon:yes stop_codon:yes gene_type:complete
MKLQNSFFPTRELIMFAIRNRETSISATALAVGVHRCTMHRYLNDPGSMPVSVWFKIVEVLEMNNPIKK